MERGPLCRAAGVAWAAVGEGKVRPPHGRLCKGEQWPRGGSGGFPKLLITTARPALTQRPGQTHLMRRERTDKCKVLEEAGDGKHSPGPQKQELSTAPPQNCPPAESPRARLGEVDVLWGTRLLSSLLNSPCL